VPSFSSSTLDAARAAKPAARIQPTSRGFVAVTAGITAASFAASFFVSAWAQVWVGGQIGLPGAAALVLPIAIDAPLIAFGMAAIAKRSRGERTWLAWLSLAVFTAASIGGNVWHGLATGDSDSIAAQIGVCAVAALIPLGVLLTSESALSILVAPPHGSAEQRQALARVADRGLLAAPGAAKRSRAETEDLAATARSMAEAGSSKAAIARTLKLSAKAVNEAVSGSPQAAGVPEFRL